MKYTHGVSSGNGVTWYFSFSQAITAARQLSSQYGEAHVFERDGATVYHQCGKYQIFDKAA